MTSKDFNRVQHALTEKLRALQEYLSLSERMWVSLEREEFDSMVEGMARREALIERVNRIDEELGVILKGPPPHNPRDRGPEGDQMSSLFRLIKETLQQIQKIDEACQERLTATKSGIVEKLRKAYQERLTVRHYTRVEDHPPALVDLRR